MLKQDAEALPRRQRLTDWLRGKHRPLTTEGVEGQPGEERVQMWPLPIFPGPVSVSPPACEAALVRAAGTGGPARAPLMDVPHPRPCRNSQLPAPTVRVSTLVLLGETLWLS